MGKIIELEITPDMEVVLQGLVRRGEYPSESAAIKGIVLNSGEEGSERRRKALAALRGIAHGPNHVPYDPREEDDLYEGMDV